MGGMYRTVHRVMAVAVAAVLVTASVRGQECPPCQEHEGRSLETARLRLTEAFRLSLEVTDCSSTEDGDRCREIDKLLEEVLETVYTIFNGHLVKEAPDCLTCDPGPSLWPVVDGVHALIALLREKGDEGFTDSRNAFVDNVDLWKNHRCPCSDPATAVEDPSRSVKRNREAEARKEILAKCGEKFAYGRRGLLQVFRVPDDRPGCYQSRACRGSTVYKGYQTQAGFWTYDGEYWYIWEERRGTSGEWVTCER
jgi:hypothetical protein